MQAHCKNSQAFNIRQWDRQCIIAIRCYTVQAGFIRYRILLKIEKKQGVITYGKLRIRIFLYIITVYSQYISGIHNIFKISEPF